MHGPPLAPACTADPGRYGQTSQPQQQQDNASISPFLGSSSPSTTSSQEAAHSMHMGCITSREGLSVVLLDASSTPPPLTKTCLPWQPAANSNSKRSKDVSAPKGPLNACEHPRKHRNHRDEAQHSNIVLPITCPRRTTQERLGLPKIALQLLAPPDKSRDQNVQNRRRPFSFGAPLSLYFFDSTSSPHLVFYIPFPCSCLFSRHTATVTTTVIHS